MNVLIAISLVACPLATVADYPASGGTVMPHDVRCPNVDEAIPTCGKRDVIGNAGSLPSFGLNGQTRVSRIASRSGVGPPLTSVANRRCFMFRMFYTPSGQHARGPPVEYPICLISKDSQAKCTETVER